MHGCQCSACQQRQREQKLLVPGTRFLNVEQIQGLVPIPDKFKGAWRQDQKLWRYPTWLEMREMKPHGGPLLYDLEPVPSISNKVYIDHQFETGQILLNILTYKGRR